ncbi:hypothetical protein K9T77_00820, partial [Escherichia coli]|nr:hypothetical protein [Escherichia coli]
AVKAPVPCPAGRGTLTTGSVPAAPRQPAQLKEEPGDIFCYPPNKTQKQPTSNPIKHQNKTNNH